MHPLHFPNSKSGIDCPSHVDLFLQITYEIWHKNNISNPILFMATRINDGISLRAVTVPTSLQQTTPRRIQIACGLV